VEQLRQLAARDVAGVPDMYQPGQLLLGKITDVIESSGHVWYEWEVIYITYSATGEPTYSDSGMLGDNEDWPYLLDVGRLANDKPTYEIDDRVIVAVVSGDTGLSYVIVGRPAPSRVTTPEDMLPTFADPPGDENAETDTWDINDQGTDDGVTLRVMTRRVQVTGTDYLFVRELTFGRDGRLLEIGAEQVWDIS